MENNSRLLIAVLASLAVSSLGCGGKFEPVSGKITANGKPVAKVQVVFTPEAVGNNANPGPYSKGVTDENGVFTLTTRDNENGAVAGPHKVGFGWADIEFDTMSFLRDELANAEGNPAKEAEIKQKIEDTRQALKSRPEVNFNEVFTIEVPVGGMTNADFDIGK